MAEPWDSWAAAHARHLHSFFRENALLIEWDCVEEWKEFAWESWDSWAVRLTQGENDKLPQPGRCVKCADVAVCTATALPPGPEFIEKMLSFCVAHRSDLLMKSAKSTASK